MLSFQAGLVASKEGIPLRRPGRTALEARRDSTRRAGWGAGSITKQAGGQTPGHEVLGSSLRDLQSR